MTNIDPEPRSFRRDKEATQVKRDPLPAHPDNADLGRAIVQVEECVHTTGATLNRKLENHRKLLNSRLKTVDERLEKIEKTQKGVRHVMGVDEEGRVVRKSPMLMSWPGLVSTLGGALAAVFLVVQIGNAVWPAIRLGAEELWSYALHGPSSAPAHHPR